MSSRGRLVALSSAAFVVYGAWAALANLGHGSHVALRAGLAQGASSATTTLLIGALVEGLRRRVSASAAALLAASVTGTFHVVVHLVAGTPELARTVAPSIAVGYLFALAYAVGTRSRGADKPVAAQV